MTLLYNWRAIVRKAWSMRLMVIAALLSGLEVALPVMQPTIALVLPTGLFAALSMLVTAAAMIARLVAQPKAEL